MFAYRPIRNNCHFHATDTAPDIALRMRAGRGNRRSSGILQHL